MSVRQLKRVLYSAGIAAGLVLSLGSDGGCGAKAAPETPKCTAGVGTQNENGKVYIRQTGRKISWHVFPVPRGFANLKENITVDGKALSKRGNFGKINVSQHGVTDWSQIEAKGAGAGSVFRAAWVVVYPPGEGRTNAWDQCYLVAP